MTTAVISHRFWWLYLLIPGYLIYFVYRKAIVPFLLGGRDPIAGLVGTITGRGAGSPAAATGAPAEATGAETMSKRQQKLQKRQERGDPRVQTQTRRR